MIAGRVIVPGTGAGEVLFSDQPLSFWGGYDQATGEIIDRRHPLSGAMAAGKILAVSASRGSSTTSAVLLEAALAGTAPAAIITAGPDRFLALASIVAEEVFGKPVPMVALSDEDFRTLAGAARAEVLSGGSVRLQA
jgi:predicted aconitase with swiveling domain